MKEAIVEHPGMVISVERGVIMVKILQVSACAGCHAKGACSVADMEEKMVEVEDYAGDELAIGQQVTLIMKRSSGNRAIVLGYLLPFMLLITVMITGSYFISSEGALALISMGSMVPYYLLLYHWRDKLKKRFRISIQA